MVLKKFCFTLLGIHVSCSVISLTIAILSQDNCISDTNLQNCLHIIDVCLSFINSVIACFGVGYLLNHMSKGPIANIPSLCHSLFPGPLPPQPPSLPPRQYDPPITDDEQAIAIEAFKSLGQPSSIGARTTNPRTRNP